MIGGDTERRPSQRRRGRGQTLAGCNGLRAFYCVFEGFCGAMIHLTGSEMSCPALERLIGRPESAGSQIIISNVHFAALRRRAAAAMAVAMTKGDVEGVLAALRRLGVRPATTTASAFRK